MSGVIGVTLLAAVLGTAGGPADAAYPGALGKIAFGADWEHPNGEIYVRDFSGGTPVRLTTNTAYDQFPVWSPDGSKIAFQSFGSGLWEIFVMNADGTGQTQMSNGGYPTWSPDGTKIAFDSDRDHPRGEIYIMNADGSNVVRLTSNSAQDFGPAWSPDGSKIAFVSDQDGEWEIVVMNADGTGQTQLTSNTSLDRSPAWSPDGSRIAFMSHQGGDWDIFVMNADGAGQTQLTFNAIQDTSPAWAPDGSKIAFDSDRDGDWDIWMMNPDGTDQVHLTDHPGNEFAPDWQPVNRPPVATNDSATVTVAGSVTIDLASNDADPDGDPLVANKATDPGHGTLTRTSATSFRYAHNGDGSTSDSFTYHVTDGHLQSNTATVTLTITHPPPAHRAASVGLVDPTQGRWHLRDYQTGAVSSFFYGNPGDVPFLGDWDCDGVATPGLFRLSDAYAYLRNTNTVGIADIRFFFGNPSDLPLAGDFNGDGCDTLSIYRPAEQRFYIINKLGKNEGGLGQADYSFVFGNPGDKPVVGDWDGDGIDEVGLHRASTGFFYYRNALDTGVADAQFYFGDPADRFVAGDWGLVDGVETPAVFRPGNTTFYFRHTNTPGNADSEFVWGDPHWLPVAGPLQP
jgi:Tol biopolymer transport system component